MLSILSKYPQVIAWFFVSLFYTDLVLSPDKSYAAPVMAVSHKSIKYGQSDWKNINTKPYAENGYANAFSINDKMAGNHTEMYGMPHDSRSVKIGPGQPEMQSFSSVNNSNMVDLFSGDFAYNIPLMDVGGYPVNLSYRSGISMDQEASWVGLGWSVNPGTINRNMRGLPDDFSGLNDSIKKTFHIKENKTIGVTGAAGAELVGVPLNLTATGGIFHNNYKGWGLEYGLNASINAGIGAAGTLTEGLSVTNNTQEGATIAPSFSIVTAQLDANDKMGFSGSASASLAYNSRSGLKGLQLNTGIRQYLSDGKNQVSLNRSFSSMISFANPSFTPSISVPFTSSQYSFTAKVGGLKKVLVNNFSISGYVSSQKVENEDTTLALPAYGYLHYQDANGNANALYDFNLEKDLPYREKPPVPHIAIPSYTYDAFSITGEGTGGMFRAYRSDIGIVNDHSMRTKDKSDRASIDVAIGDIVHGGVDLNINRAYSQNGPWLENNAIRNIIGFKQDTADFQAAYFRNPSEKSVNSKRFYESVGGDDVVAIGLYQPNKSSSFIQATNYLNRYRNKRLVGNSLLKPDSTYKTQRDKRTQVITYLNAKEADVAGLSRYIENYTPNIFGLAACGQELPEEGLGAGLPGDYYNDKNLGQKQWDTINGPIDFRNTQNHNNPMYVPPIVTLANNNYSVRWTGRVRTPEAGRYTFQLIDDDGIRLWLNDSLVFERWDPHPARLTDTFSLYLLANEFYKIKLEYYQESDKVDIALKWRLPSQPLNTYEAIGKDYLYFPAVDTFAVSSALTKEKRVNNFRKDNHISEVSVLNNDGRRYVYGIPVYNFKQKESTFAVDTAKANLSRGLVGYSVKDNSSQNERGIDNYYSSEEIPAYAQAFLLTGILSADYVDVSGNGISDDDLGDAVKLNYSKVSGINNPFKWRIPYIKDSANYNEGLKTDRRDDKGSIVSGEKELWYLHSIISKTMIATFVTESRSDLLSIDDRGAKQNNGAAKRLKEINLYSKADFARKGTGARPIKTVHFEYSYELCKGINKDIGSDDGKLTLRKVWFTYNNNDKGKLNPYVFYYQNNPVYQPKAYDRWGNYKNAGDNPGSLIGDVIANDEYPYVIQDSTISGLNAAAWSLDSIVLPSGGSIKADFESDDYAFVQDKRSMQMLKPAGFASSPAMTTGFSSLLYDGSVENKYIYFNLPEPVSTSQDFYRKYLDGIQKLYFRLFVKMPADNYGSGSEYVSGYADIAETDGYGISSESIGWIRVAGISVNGDGPGESSPMFKAATQFLRLNLPSKAYPNSEPGDDLSPSSAVKMVFSSLPEITNAFKSFDQLARTKHLAQAVDLNRSFIRLDNAEFKKYGGGHRVKRIKIYDNWNKMTQRRAAVYGQEYSYTTQKEVGGEMMTISSGVASYEPGLGGEENPFRQPIEYVDKSSILGPVTLGYSEEPLGECFFPAASVGYSSVKVRTLNHTNTRSANGLEETRFYTTYDFPTYTDRSLLDDATKKRFKPSLANFLRINARHHMVLSQGFKVELNDMNGKLRSQASYAETDLNHPFSYTENIYKTEDISAEHKRLSNTVLAIDPAGDIDSTALIGKDVELMVAMREQLSVNAGYNVNVNLDVFNIPMIPFVFAIPSIIPLYQHEENLYRSAATVKVIQRYGILDSVIQIDKGSKISTKDVLYDSETGDVLLSRTQNEFNDPVYQFTYPSHWAYDAMGLAYKNVDVVFAHVSVKQGKIMSGIPDPERYFSSGDEILVAGKLQTDQSTGCYVEFSSFPSYSKIWAISRTVLTGGDPEIYLIDRNGNPYNGYDVTFKIVRSGRRNILSSVGAVTSLVNPIQYDVSDQLVLKIDSSSQVLNTSAAEFNQFWKVDDRKVAETQLVITGCDTLIPICTGGKNFFCRCNCLSKMFNYLTTRHRLITPIGSKILLSDMLTDASDRGYGMPECALFNTDASSFFYSISTDSVGMIYEAQMGLAKVKISSPFSVNFNHLKPWECLTVGADTVYLHDTISFPNTHIRDAKMWIESYNAGSCDTVLAQDCLSIITNTGFNPYTTGVLGSWRLNRNYSYYRSRAQTDPSTLTNIRTDGTIADFNPFWNFQSGGLVPQYDTTRWVWNSEMTLFNRKGFEIENKDPLGRYNSGLYGYNVTMPVAVVQNSRYRESGFEGFEDYDFTTQVCDTVCAENRQFDFSSYKGQLDTVRRHSGKSSLRLTPDTYAALSFDLSDESVDTLTAEMNFNMVDVCSTTALGDVEMNKSILLPNFSPLKGKGMMLSAWVQEDQDCKCSTYVKNNITVSFNVGPTITFHPSGSIIEGWQRYESVFDIPDNASIISITLNAPNDVSVNFDDVRIHPFNANMKSFVFHPANLRLMAELDENNYATFYEYDDDGTLIRLKKETQRGIKTIKETRSALLKD